MNVQQPTDILQQYWGFDQFRPLQEDIVRAVIGGQDALALLPTGGGKSICFQVPGLALGGLCLVISPLIALMKDQVLNLTKRNIKATAIFTGMTKGEIDKVLEACAAGKYNFLYVSPERLTTKVFLARMGRLNIRLIAVDEAHCISQWGHDFRPEYLRIAEIRPFLKGVPLIALTATATPKVVKEIQSKLGINKEHLFKKSFLRSNLAYKVAYDEDKFGRLIRFAKATTGTGVVYAGTRRRTQQIADLLKRSGVQADYYHAGLNPQERDFRQKEWINNNIRVIVCTNAFGMGIDKPDVRFVVHLSPSDCIEAYFQEAGRAGRDEAPAQCLLLYHPSDRVEAERYLELSFPSPEQIQKIYGALGMYFNLALGSGKGQTFPFSLSEFSQQFDFKSIEVHHALQFLHRTGYFHVGEDVLLPSKVMFTAAPTVVYDFRLRHKNHDHFIDVLLRSYGGIMDQYTKIDEYRLAGKLNVPLASIQQSLRELQEKELLDYIPKTDKPTITYLHERIPEAGVVLPPEHYSQLRSDRRAKLEAMLHYAESRGKCRSQMLLSYFGEVESTPCGCCDYCSGLQQEEPDQDSLKILKPMIKSALSKELSFNELIDFISFDNRVLLMSCVQWLIDQNQIELQANNLLKWKA